MFKNMNNLIRHLRKKLPPDRPVRVRFRPMKQSFGTVNYYKDVYNIAVDSKLDYNNTVDALLHEWAHCLDGVDPSKREEHRQSWAIFFGKCYRVYLEWEKENK